MAVEKAPKSTTTTAKKAEKVEDPAADLDALAAEADVEDGVEPDDHDVLLVRDKRFRLVTAIPAMTMLKLSASSDPKTPVPKQMEAIASFLTRIVIEEDREEFLAFLEDADPVIDFEEINTILTDATEAISARPTQQ